MNRIERAIETAIFHSRWVLAPFYLGLIVSLMLLFVHFVRQLAEFILHIVDAKESDVILGVLGLIDLTFTANLIVIVIFSGYENFVSKKYGNTALAWLVGIHVVFVVSLLCLAIVDRLSAPPGARQH